MKALQTLTREEATPAAQGVFDQLKAKLGMVPNLYATVANSDKALNALLTLGENLKGGAFSAKEVEAIALSVGQANNCDYCLAAHTAVGKLTGFSEEETLQIRNGEVEDTKLAALVGLASDITNSKGHPSQASIDAFFEAGYSKAALAELIGFVSLNVFTNYFNHIAETAVDFPAAPALSTVN